MTTAFSHRSIQSIVVFRALQLGDMLCAVPALRALRSAFPRAKIVLAGLPWASWFAARFNAYLDGFIAFPGYPGLPEITPDIYAYPRFLSQIQRRHFDLAIQLHGSGAVVNEITALMGAKHCAGFCEPGGYCPDNGLFMPFPAQGHEIQKLLDLMRFLKIPLKGEHLELPLTPADCAEGNRLAGRFHFMNRPYFCIHPGSRLASRRWIAERFAQAADAMASRGFIPVITGSMAERPLARQVGAAMRSKPVMLAGHTTIGGLAAVMQRARMVLTNDTGVSHIAAALAVPSVVITTGSDPERWAPLNRSLHRAVYAAVPCRPCGFDECPSGYRCATELKSETVIAEAGRILTDAYHFHPGAGAI